MHTGFNGGSGGKQLGGVSEADVRLIRDEYIDRAGVSETLIDDYRRSLCCSQLIDIGLITKEAELSRLGPR